MRTEPVPPDQLPERRFSQPGRLQGPNVAHVIRLQEGGGDGVPAECPGVFEIKCTCGWRRWAPFGLAQAEEQADIHLFQNGVPLHQRNFVTL
jgi:hypothetical protein